MMMVMCSDDGGDVCGVVGMDTFFRRIESWPLDVNKMDGQDQVESLKKQLEDQEKEANERELAAKERQEAVKEREKEVEEHVKELEEQVKDIAKMLKILKPPPSPPPS
ncbi:hypothetical protein Tco_0855370 [Tanacetum coccineum]